MRIEIKDAQKVYYMYNKELIKARLVGYGNKGDKVLLWVPVSSHKNFECPFFVVAKQEGSIVESSISTPIYKDVKPELYMNIDED